MVSVSRFACAAVAAIGLGLTLAPVAVPALVSVLAADAAEPSLAEIEQSCLNPKERRAETEAGKLVRLTVAMHAARSRMPGTIVRARLCHGPDGLVYVLTVLAHDGKVAQIAVDAIKGTLVGGL
jgi:uncharacterized membrane protein YkoI